MADYNLVEILERRGERGFYPLNENHWSNVLAWLLTHQHEQSLGRSLLELFSPGWSGANWTVEREIEYIIGNRKCWRIGRMAFGSFEQASLDHQSKRIGGIRPSTNLALRPSQVQLRWANDQI